MKNNILLYILLAGLLLCGCTSDDGRLDPTYADIDWFAIQPSDDPLDGLRYDIYKKNRISVYYNDTIGSQYRGMSGYGDSVIHYEILDLCYTIEENNQTVEYTLSADRDKLYDAIKFVQQKVIPAIPAIAYPKSLLLVKELILNTTSSTTMRVGKTWTAMMTTAIGAVEDIQGMTADEHTCTRTRRNKSKISTPSPRNWLNGKTRKPGIPYTAVSWTIITKTRGAPTRHSISGTASVSSLPARTADTPTLTNTLPRRKRKTLPLTSKPRSCTGKPSIDFGKT